MNAPTACVEPPTIDFRLLGVVLPQKMLAARRWLLWRFVPNGDGKPKKVPHYANGNPRGATDTPRDLNSLETIDVVKAAAASQKWDGIGFALGKDGDGHWQGIDLDHVSEKPWLEYPADNLIGYTEKSPSGNGWHAIGYGEDLKTITPNESGIEVYSKGRYFTVTGDSAGGELCDLAPFVRDILDPILDKHRRQPTEESEETEDTEDTEDTEARGGGRTATSGNRTIVPIPKETLRALLPTEAGHRNKKVFDLARYCIGKYPAATRDELKPLVRQWHKAALPFIGTKEFSETWADFCISLPRVKFPKGAQLNEIMERIQAPTEAPPEHEDIGLIGYRLLLICAALQATNGEEPFFLSYRTAGDLIGRHFTDAGKLLKFLVMEGYLEEAQKGDTHKATRYRLLKSP